MNILIPLEITEAMIGAGTSITEPAADETEWVSGGTYAVDDERIRKTTHKVYVCVQAHSGRTALPEKDGAYWLEKGPTQLFAPFDIYASTAATATGSITYVLTPGYFNSITLYGLVGTTLTVTLKDEEGGAVIFSDDGDLSEPPLGFYEYLFSPLKLITKKIFTDLPIRPAAELTITVTSGEGEPVGIGMINVGDYDSIVGDSWGGTEFGAKAEPVSYSYIKMNPDGTTKIVRRVSATSMRGVAVLPREDADQALLKIQSVLDVPVSCVATNSTGYDGLNVFGLMSASVSYDSAGHASIDFTVKGLI